jgi:hypothetical protein
MIESKQSGATTIRTVLSKNIPAARKRKCLPWPGKPWSKRILEERLAPCDVQ